MKLNEAKIAHFFTKGHSMADEMLDNYTYPWEVLADIGKIISALSKNLGEDYSEISKNVWAHKTAKIMPSAFLGENIIIGENTEVRHCAFLRGNALIGNKCVVGNSTELKNVILFNNVQVPHFNYIGDSILGFKSHLGAGAITSNVKGNFTLVSVCFEDERVETGLKKFGAIVGDNVEVGCNSVLNPGTIIGEHTQVYPLSMVRGVINKNAIYKKQGEVVEKLSVQ